MRTLEDLCGALDASGLPWANGQWWPQEPPPLPYALLCGDGATSFFADGRTYCSSERYRIELYSHGRSYECEAAVRDALDDAGFPWDAAPGVPVDQTDVTVAYLYVTVALPSN